MTPLSAPPSFWIVKVPGAAESPSATPPKSALGGDIDSDGCLRSKVAVTFLAASRVTSQEPLPVQPAPDQAMKSLFGSAAAVSVIVACAKLTMQVEPHEMPSGLEVTRPVPVPAFS